MEYYSAIKRNTFESVLMRWMNLEPIIQSEVSQKEKNKYRILTHVCEIMMAKSRFIWYKPIYFQAGIDIQTENNVWARVLGGRQDELGD